jgi:hypothetical protein
MALLPIFAVGHTTGTLSAIYCPKKTIEAANILPGEFRGKSLTISEFMPQERNKPIIGWGSVWALLF